MIQEDSEPKPIDFSWYLFIGRNKLGLSFKETMRLTLKMFEKLYQHYKEDFDLEMQMKITHTTYSKLKSMVQKEDEWF